MRSPFERAGRGADEKSSPKQEAATKHDVKDHWFSFGDCCLAVTECLPTGGAACAQGQTLFFLHGRFGQAEIWEELCGELATRFRCLRLDLPGFGRSFSAQARGLSLLEQSLIVRSLVRTFLRPGERAVLVGHDIGGAIAQLCAIHEPEAFGGLVLINSAMLTWPARDLKPGWFCLQARRRLQRLLSMAPIPLRPEHETMLVTAWESRQRRLSLMQAFRAWEYAWPGPFERQAWKESIRRLAQPVLLLWGKADPINPPEAAEELMRSLPEAYLFENEGCGHWPCLEDPDWVELKVREFLFRLGLSDPVRASRLAGFSEDCGKRAREA